MLSGDGGGGVDRRLFLRKLLGRVRDWSAESDTDGAGRPIPRRPALVVLDDFGALASSLGGDLAFGFLQCLRTTARASAGCGPALAVRCGADAPSERARAEGQMGWIGSGRAPPVSPAPRWDDVLPLIADCTVDCAELPSGPSRAAHGRITVSVRRRRDEYGVPNGGGAGGDGKIVLNYVASPDGSAGG